MILKTLEPIEHESISRFRQALSTEILGQDEAIATLVDSYTTIQAGFAPSERPKSITLMLGPTGVGKTRLVEEVDRTLHGTTNLIKVDCGEFQSNHEIAKLVGAPPGYLGHEAGQGRLTPAKVAKVTTRSPIKVLLFDEIEKAGEALYNLLLSILDRGVATMGDGAVTDFTHCWIFFTSNLGSRDGRYEAATREKFSPEFRNRVDTILVFNHLTKEVMSSLLNKEVSKLGDMVGMPITILPEQKATILEKGFSTEYGARHLKRWVHTNMTVPLARLKLGGLPEGVNRLYFGDGKFHIKESTSATA